MVTQLDIPSGQLVGVGRNLLLPESGVLAKGGIERRSRFGILPDGGSG